MFINKIFQKLLSVFKGKENFFSDPTLLIKGNVIEWGDKFIQISNITQIDIYAGKRISILAIVVYCCVFFWICMPLMVASLSPLYNLNSHVLFVPFKFIPFLFVSGIVGLATYVFYKKLYKIYYVLSIQLTSGSVNSFVSNNYSCIKETWRILEQIIEKGNIVNKKVTVDLKNGSIDGNIIISDTNEYLDFGDKTINN